jgi:tellurite resistance protein TerC
VDLELWMWVAFAGFVAAMLLVDLLAFGRRQERIRLRRAVGWSIGWTLLGLSFAAFLWLWRGRQLAGEYLAGFLIEKSLSIDNLFVFALIFASLGVPTALQRRALFWGIVGAILLRAIFILAGAALLDAFHYTIYVFGGFLVVTGIRFARHQTVEIHPERNPLLKLMQRVLPMSSTYQEDRFLVRERRRLVATPMLAALALIAAFDVIFAVDSIPAIFAVTRETFIVYAANAFSLLGLGALYFVLADMIERFRYLNLGLAAVLVFVGLKMTLADVYEIPVVLSLVFIVAALAAAVATSLARPAPSTPRPTDAAHAHLDPQAVRRQTAQAGPHAR